MGDSVFVLGAGGFIGRSLCRYLSSQGWTVFAGTRQPAAFGDPRIVNVVTPFSEAGHFIPWVEKCAAVVHAASHTTPSSSAAQPQLDGNLRSTLALIEALQELPGRLLIYLSSSGVLYEERDGLVGEDTPLRPRSYHGAGKVAAEHFIRAWAIQCDGLAYILRPSNVYGPGQYPRKGFGIIPAAFECMRKGLPLQVWGDGGNVRDYLYIDDFVSLCAKVLCAPLSSGTHVFNASSGAGVSLKELLARIRSITGRDIEQECMPARTIDMRRIVPDNTRAYQRFAWKPQVGLDEGLASTWRWFETVHD